MTVSTNIFCFCWHQKQTHFSKDWFWGGSSNHSILNMDFFFFLFAPTLKDIYFRSLVLFNEETTFLARELLAVVGWKDGEILFFDHPKNPKTPSKIGVIFRTLYTRPCYIQVQTNSSIGGSLGILRANLGFEKHNHTLVPPETQKQPNDGM